jgi:hypothetical protein
MRVVKARTRPNVVPGPGGNTWSTRCAAVSVNGLTYRWKLGYAHGPPCRVPTSRTYGALNRPPKPTSDKEGLGRGPRGTSGFIMDSLLSIERHITLHFATCSQAVNLSLPGPPTQRSDPPPPFSLSLPAWPNSLSLPAPPLMVSFPPPPHIISFPPEPIRTSFLAVPTMTSAPWLPRSRPL